MELLNISFTFMKIKLFPECKFPEERNYNPLVHSGVTRGQQSTWPYTGTRFTLV